MIQVPRDQSKGGASDLLSSANDSTTTTHIPSISNNVPGHVYYFGGFNAKTWRSSYDESAAN